MKFTEYLAREGYRPYEGAVDASVYAGFRCPNPDKAAWMYKPGSFQCAGCKEQCETDSPGGFQLFLGMAGFEDREGRQ